MGGSALSLWEHGEHLAGLRSLLPSGAWKLNSTGVFKISFKLGHGGTHL